MLFDGIMDGKDIANFLTLYPYIDPTCSINYLSIIPIISYYSSYT